MEENNTKFKELKLTKMTQNSAAPKLEFSINQTKGEKIFDFEFCQIYSIIAKVKKMGKFTI